MFKTIYDTTTGKIVVCQKFNDVALQTKLLENSNWDYIDAYTKGVKNIEVDPVTKKLRRVAPPAETTEDIVKYVRATRLRLLQLSDWTQTVDSPLSEAKKQEWAAYRQALRDMPDTVAGVNSSSEVVWPTQP
jgi:hypothetical protein